MQSADVVIVGAGLAGLCCARRLAQARVSFLLLEASDAVGGRVRTDHVDGFRLDRGFQVLLTAYPEARRSLDYQALDLRAFEPGALVRLDHRFRRVSDPWRRPGRAFEALVSPIGTLSDKLRLAWLRAKVCRGPADGAFALPAVPTLDFLRQQGFSPGMVEQFFRPFLGGIFLEPELRTPSSMFRFVFRMMAQGDVSIPALGMQQIPRQLASALPPAALRLGSRVASIGAGRVTLADGEALTARGIVLATEGPEAARLLKAEPAASRGVTCLYFAAESAPVTEPILMLNGDGRGPVNNLCFPSVVSPALAPPGAVLVSATVLDSALGNGGELEAEVRAQLMQWFGGQVARWRLLRTYRIHHAQPEPSVAAQAPRIAPGLYVCGDHCLHASIEGAMASGRKTAEALLADMHLSD